MAQWFGPKRFGYGIGPRRWQGWAMVAATLAAVFAIQKFFHPQAWGLPYWSLPVVLIAIVLAFLLVMFLTYEDDPG